MSADDTQNVTDNHVLVSLFAGSAAAAVVLVVGLALVLTDTVALDIATLGYACIGADALVMALVFFGGRGRASAPQ
ncbi:hypothetical protein [Halomarina rubra]|uniref:Uncharacterized protein n=1 Tax=Halomarina rubra TaxID=2071873 RepID=A0ABD6AP85_9EURY|nr:hypothetical protein [Halomarina rubra]